MRQAIVTLPITPRQDPKIGLLVQPVLMDLLGSALGLRRVMCLNLNGAKLSEDEREDSVSGYLDACSFVGVFPDWVWRDDLHAKKAVQDIFDQLCRTGYVREEPCRVLACPCGAVEMLEEAENASQTKRLYEVVANQRICKVCDSALETVEVVAHIFQISDVEREFLVTPGFTGVELKNLGKRFVGGKILVSRMKDTDVSVIVRGSKVFLDVDFAWQMYPVVLESHGYQVKVMIGSHQNLWGCFMTLMIQSLLGNTATELVVPAYCKIKDAEDKVVLQGYRQWNPKVTRLFLAAHTTFRKKEHSFDLSIEKLIWKTARSLEGVSPRQLSNLQDGVTQYEGASLLKDLAEARRSKSPSVRIQEAIGVAFS